MIDEMTSFVESQLEPQTTSAARWAEHLLDPFGTRYRLTGFRTKQA